MTSSNRSPAARLGRTVAVLACLAVLAALAALAQADIVQKGNLRVSASAKMRPRALPRTGAVPIAVSVSGHVATADETQPPQLSELTIEINRHGHLDFAGLPICKVRLIQPASDSRALAACRSSLVGEGKFFGTITLPGATPYAMDGRLLVFNGREHGHQVLLGHIYSPHPFAISFVMTFQIESHRHGVYGTTLRADLRKALGTKRNLTGIEMTLSRRWHFGGRRHSYLSAGCPAPKGFGSAVFPLARTTFTFAGGTQLSSVLTSTCQAKG
ncbi:MAG TPA: hypothetical protein VF009_07440 [Solirubrobacterales bacterium]